MKSGNLFFVLFLSIICQVKLPHACYPWHTLKSPNNEKLLLHFSVAFIKHLKNNQETAFKFESYLNSKYIGQNLFHWIRSNSLLRQHKRISLWQHLSSWEYPWWKGNFSWHVVCLPTFFASQSHQSRHSKHGGTEVCSCTVLIRLWCRAPWREPYQQKRGKVMIIRP